MSARDEAIAELATLVAARTLPHPTRVAVDGITASGKTTLANELAAALAATGPPVLRLSMDGYHHPRAHRYRQGRGSADGYYEDAYDFPSFAELVLRPLGPGGAGRYTPAIIDLPTDTPLDRTPVPVPGAAWLVVDGSFLQRDELAGLWDVVVWVDTPFAEARRRGIARDTDLLGGVDAAATAFDERYHAAARRYLAEVDPAAHADVVFVNTDVHRSEVRRVG